MPTSQTTLLNAQVWQRLVRATHVDDILRQRFDCVHRPLRLYGGVKTRLTTVISACVNDSRGRMWKDAWLSQQASHELAEE